MQRGVTVINRGKPGVVEVRVKVDEDWVQFAVHGNDLFLTTYCGYWMRGMEYDKRLGWLCFEHGGEKRPPKEVPARILKRWRDGDDLPKRWHRLDRDTAILAWAAGVKLAGDDWYSGPGADASRYDFVIQMALGVVNPRNRSESRYA
jgi:hypothetical protein